MQEIPLNFVHVHSGMEIRIYRQDFRLEKAHDLLKTRVTEFFHDDLAIAFQQEFHQKMNTLLRTVGQKDLLLIALNAFVCHQRNDMRLQGRGWRPVLQ
jgi:hypothetical protein